MADGALTASKRARGTPPEEPQPRMVNSSDVAHGRGIRSNTAKKASSVRASASSRRPAADLGQLVQHVGQIGRLVAPPAIGTGAR